jgi:hypothetical protein
MKFISKKNSYNGTARKGEIAWAECLEICTLGS